MGQKVHPYGFRLGFNKTVALALVRQSRITPRFCGKIWS